VHALEAQTPVRLTSLYHVMTPSLEKGLENDQQLPLAASGFAIVRSMPARRIRELCATCGAVQMSLSYTESACMTAPATTDSMSDKTGYHRTTITARKPQHLISVRDVKPLKIIQSLPKATRVLHSN